MVNEQHIKNALDISLEEASTPENINKAEFKDIRKRFDGLMNQLEEECEDGGDEEED